MRFFLFCRGQGRRTLLKPGDAVAEGISGPDFLRSGSLMKLSDELFREVVNGLRLPDGRARRVPLVGRATIIPCSPGVSCRPAAVVVRDLSPTGIGLLQLVELK